MDDQADETDDIAAISAVRSAAARLGIDLPALVAEVALWVAPEVHARFVTPTNQAGAVRPDVRRARVGSGERPGDVVDGVRLDRNNYAGQALREALKLPREAVRGFQACHVWPDTCYDARYHTVLANLVLVPGPLVSLTDHDPDVVAGLKFRSFELYGWHPIEAAAPSRPPRYPINWKGPAAPIARRAATPRPVRSAPIPASAVRPGSQRDVMRRLWTLHGGDERAVVRAWAEAVRSGAAERQSNERGQTQEEYAKRLIYDGRKKGWLP